MMPRASFLRGRTVGKGERGEKVKGKGQRCGRAPKRADRQGPAGWGRGRGRGRRSRGPRGPLGPQPPARRVCWRAGRPAAAPRPPAANPGGRPGRGGACRLRRRESSFLHTHEYKEPYDLRMFVGPFESPSVPQFGVAGGSMLGCRRNTFYSLQLCSSGRPVSAPPFGSALVDDYVASEGAVQRVLVPAYAKQLSPATQLAIQRATSETGPENGSKLPPPRPEDMLNAAAALDGALEESGPGGTGELRHSLGFTASPCRTRGSGQKNSRRKRDLVLSKLVHNVHNHITNDKRFNGSESIKSSWNISVVKFLLEKLKQELVTSPHNYTDKELKGACVAYFLTKRREYRNSLNPFKGLKEKEEKKLRSRRYRLFANRSSIMRHFGPEDQRLWKDVTEELMSDEEDSLNEPGVWVARPPRFRAQRLTELCYHLDANSKHGTKANRVYGPPSDRLPSAEAQLLPPELYNPNFQEEEDEGGDENGPVSPSFDQPHKTCCPDLNSFIEIKVEKDE
ncbi:uncharacterized protein C14orf93 homolog isoform X2 [Vulpes lagopus]|uniref:uncharacterized protein C14orf93 homolog isoform X2 n=1 Tax=Vulpes lagopus TaxID=494514 RepID=UPI001BC8FCCE|nr:uncharacterized protein C14orf93 homolog isoform X2 [Vulpes lagopus]